jgi:hypothetical protein
MAVYPPTPCSWIRLWYSPLLYTKIDLLVCVQAFYIGRRRNKTKNSRSRWRKADCATTNIRRDTRLDQVPIATRHACTRATYAIWTSTSLTSRRKITAKFKAQPKMSHIFSTAQDKRTFSTEHICMDNWRRRIDWGHQNLSVAPSIRPKLLTVYYFILRSRPTTSLKTRKRWAI